jgi:hypothetical protein
VANADDRFGAIGQWSLETTYQFGRIIPHNSKFKAPVRDFTHNLEVSFYKQTLGEKAWQRQYHYPELGGSFAFSYNGDQKVFGNAYFLMAVAKFWIVRSRYVDFYVRAGTGLAFTPTHFNIVTNKENNAIGSLVNSVDQLRLGVDFKMDDHVQISWAGSFTHYSNAGIQKPNLGVNIPALSVSVRYFFKTSNDLKYNRNRVPKPEKKNEVMVKFGLAVSEGNTYNGPKYPTYIATVNYARYTSIANKVLAGASFEFSQGAYDGLVYYEDKRKFSNTVMAMNASVFAGDEVLLGKVGLFFVAGVYVFNPRKETPAYVKLGFNYYFAHTKNDRTKFFIGSNLKTHFLVAQFYEAALGVAF